MYAESWSTIFCPHCNAKNWLNHGDLSDCTIPDIEALQCWKCEQKSFLDEDEFKLINHWKVFEACNDEDCEYKTWNEILEDASFCEWGRKNPNDPLRF